MQVIEENQGYLTIIVNGETAYKYEINKIITLPSGFEYRNRYKNKYVSSFLVNKLKNNWEGKKACLVLKTSTNFIPLRWVIIKEVTKLSQMIYIRYELSSLIKYSEDTELNLDNIESYTHKISKELKVEDKSKPSVLVLASQHDPSNVVPGKRIKNEDQVIEEMDQWGFFTTLLSTVLDFEDVPFLKVLTIEKLNSPSFSFRLSKDKIMETLSSTPLTKAFSKSTFSKLFLKKNINLLEHEFSKELDLEPGSMYEITVLHEILTPPTDTNSPAKSEERISDQANGDSTRAINAEVEKDKRWKLNAPYKLGVSAVTGSLNILRSEEVANGKSDRIGFIFETQTPEKDEKDFIIFNHNTPGESAKHISGNIIIPVKVKSAKLKKWTLWGSVMLSLLFYGVTLFVSSNSSFELPFLEKTSELHSKFVLLLSSNFVRDFAIASVSVSIALLLSKSRK